MDLPLVDEIREARRLNEDSHDASVQMIRLEAALTSTSILQRQLALRADLDVDLPGEDVIGELAERWTELADLEGAGPRPSATFSTRLRLRTAQLETARQLLLPLKRLAPERAKHLHDLQHIQREQLEDPRYTEIVAELGVLGTARSEATSQLQPLTQRLSLVDPAKKLVDTFVMQLDASIQDLEGGDPNGLRAWRAASISRSLLQALSRLLVDLQLEIPIPEAIVVPDAPHPDSSEPLMVEVRRIRDELETLRTTLDAEGETLHETADALQKRFEELTQQIIDRMG